MPRESRLRWCLLVHALPARPLYLRARIRRELAQAGAAPLKNAVYCLPWSEPGMRRLRALAEEIEAAGASAFVCEATFPDEAAEAAVIRACNAERQSRYRAWMEDAESAARGRAGKHTASPRARAAGASGTRSRNLSRLRERLEILREQDSFGAPGATEAAALLADLERRSSTPARAGHARTGLVGRRWVTRRGLHIDRLACAWVVRRFVDPSATFRFVSATEAPLAKGEIGFDMPGAEITHEGGRCSVEALLLRAGIGDPGAVRIAEIVHDIDLKDGRHAHPETAGFEGLLIGTIASHPRDEDRLEHGLRLFDALHAALSRGGGMPGPAPSAPRVRIPDRLARRSRS